MGKSKKSARKVKSEAPEHYGSHPIREGVALVAELPAEYASPADAEAVVTTRKAKKETASKVQREERNGVKRPGPGKCLEVWEYLDQHGDMMGKDLKPIAVEKSWNANNALIELYQWRKFNGITRAAAK